MANVEVIDLGCTPDGLKRSVAIFPTALEYFDHLMDHPDQEGILDVLPYFESSSMSLSRRELWGRMRFDMDTTDQDPFYRKNNPVYEFLIGSEPNLRRMVLLSESCLQPPKADTEKVTIYHTQSIARAPYVILGCLYKAPTRITFYRSVEVAEGSYENKKNSNRVCLVYEKVQIHMRQ